MKNKKAQFLAISLIMIFFFISMGSIVAMSYHYSKLACEEEGLKYNRQGQCFEYDGSRVITYELETQGPFTLRFKVNKYPSVEN